MTREEKAIETLQTIKDFIENIPQPQESLKIILDKVNVALKGME